MGQRPTRFPVLRYMAAMKAAREFGLESRSAAEIALSFNPARRSLPARHEELVDALASALVHGGPMQLPDSP